MSETKNRGGRPRVDAVPITLRVPPNLLSPLDAFAADTVNEDAPIGRPEAIRRILKDWLIGHGYAPNE